ncbi:hypothetical protein, partial [Escherichia coli]|uniref:hypothetical protein n=1 Tax=Escherichia coli TaxID=562 RepID=UPI001EF70987
RAKLCELLEFAFSRVIVLDGDFARNEQLEVLDQAIVVDTFVGRVSKGRPKNLKSWLESAE